MVNRAISGLSLDKLHLFLLSYNWRPTRACLFYNYLLPGVSNGAFGLKYLAIILTRLNGDGLGRAYFRADRVPHVPAEIAFDRHLIDRRGIDDPKGANHDAHPAGYTCRFMNVYQSRFRIPPHGSIGARIQAGRFHAMPALQGKLFALDIHPGHRLRFLDNRASQLFGNRCDFRCAPQFALVASGTFLGVYLYNLQFVLLIKKGSKVQSSPFRVTFNYLVIWRSSQTFLIIL
jgi:hypothetical protein